MNKYVKGLIGLGIAAATIVAFLAWPNSIADENTSVADGNTPDNVEDVTVLKTIDGETPKSFENVEHKAAASSTNQDIIDRTNEAAKRSEDAGALEVEVIADDN